MRRWLKTYLITHYSWNSLNPLAFPLNIVATDMQKTVPKHTHDFHELVIFMRGSAVHRGRPKRIFLTTKGTKKHEDFVGKLLSEPDISSSNFAFPGHEPELRQNF